MNGATSIVNLTLGGNNLATLAGTGNITVSGALNWSSQADIAGNGSLTTNGVTTLSGTKAGINKNWINNGTVNIAQGSYINFQGVQTLGGTGNVVFTDGSQWNALPIVTRWMFARNSSIVRIAMRSCEIFTSTAPG